VHTSVEEILMNLQCGQKKLGLMLNPGTDVMIFKIFSPKNFAKKIGVFDSKQS
jgi:hypothetical protein